MWDEEPATEPPPNEPKPPEYEFIMESDMNMFARMKIMDPDMPPPTIRSGTGESGFRVLSRSHIVYVHSVTYSMVDHGPYYRLHSVLLRA